jgi:hypothetical protein
VSAKDEELGLGPVIASYTRAQALEDGQLIDVTTAAREAGFRIPVAMTQAAWADCVEWTEENDRLSSSGQDQEGRLWDVVWMASRACKRAMGGVCEFELYRVRRGDDQSGPLPVRLRMVIGPGDDPEPVITIMMPDED